MNFIKTKIKAALSAAVLGLVAFGAISCNTITTPAAGTSSVIVQRVILSGPSSAYYGEEVKLTASTIFSDSSYVSTGSDVSYQWFVTAGGKSVSSDTNQKSTYSFKITENASAYTVKVIATMNGTPTESDTLSISIGQISSWIFVKAGQNVGGTGTEANPLMSRLNGSIAFDVSGSLPSSYKIECTPDASLGATWNDSAKTLTMNASAVTTGKVVFKLYVQGSDSSKTYVTGTDSTYYVKALGTKSGDYKIALTSDKLDAQTVTSVPGKAKIQITDEKGNAISDTEAVYYADITSGTPSVVAVSGITLTAKAAGSSKITVTVGTKTENFTVEVLSTSLTSASDVAAKTVSIATGKTKTLKELGIQTGSETITVGAVSDTNVITVSDSGITAGNTGKATLTVYKYTKDSYGYVTKHEIVNTVNVGVAETSGFIIKVNGTAVTALKPGYKDSVTFTVEPKTTGAIVDVSDFVFTETTNAPSLTTADTTGYNFKLTTGSADYTSTMKIGGLTGISVEVKNRPTGVLFKKSGYEVKGYILDKEKTESSFATFTYGNSSATKVDSDVVYTSSNESVATISNNTVTTITEGSTLITVELTNGQKGYCLLTVISGATYVPETLGRTGGTSYYQYEDKFDGTEKMTYLARAAFLEANVSNPAVTTQKISTYYAVDTGTETANTPSKLRRVDAVILTNATASDVTTDVTFKYSNAKLHTNNNSGYKISDETLYNYCSHCGFGVAYKFDSTTWGSVKAGVASVNEDSTGAIKFSNVSVAAGKISTVLVLGRQNGNHVDTETEGGTGASLKTWKPFGKDWL